MATYTYTGKLTDFSEQPFPDAAPALWVEADKPAYGPNGPLSTKRIPVVVAANGNFSVDLVASVDTSPTVKYGLFVKWLHGDGSPAGQTEWEFTAVQGGGPIKDMTDAPVSAWWVGPPWPPNQPRGFYLDKDTNDVWRKQ